MQKQKKKILQQENDNLDCDPRTNKILQWLMISSVIILLHGDEGGLDLLGCWFGTVALAERYWIASNFDTLKISICRHTIHCKICIK